MVVTVVFRKANRFGVLKAFQVCSQPTFPTSCYWLRFCSHLSSTGSIRAWNHCSSSGSFRLPTALASSRKFSMALSEQRANAACKKPDPETKDYLFQQTMLRVKDPEKSLDFYTRVMGMTLLLKLDFPEMKFSLYFMAYDDPEKIPTDHKERVKYCFMQKATLELTHNYGTEDDPDQAYHNGNDKPQGFGHIGIKVPDVYAACERFEKLGVNFVKKPNDGKMKGLAFIKDPDGYWIEILNPDGMTKIV